MTPVQNLRIMSPRINSEENDVGDLKDESAQDIQSDTSETLPEQTEHTQPNKATKTTMRKNPANARRKLAHLKDFETYNMEDKLKTSVDSCYRVICDKPQTYQEAITSTNLMHWRNAMDKEMQSLEENKTFTLTQLPQGKHPVGGRLIYTRRFKKRH